MPGWRFRPGFSAEVMAGCGWDSVTVDMQHGVQDYQSMVQCFQAMDRFPITPLVRVPWNEPGIIGKALDGGAWGIICPMVNNKAEAQALVVLQPVSAEGQAQQRPDPRGGVRRGSNYQTTANDEVLVIPMIETQDGIDNIDEILSVPGISGIYIGPSDMGFSLGLVPKLDREEPLILGIYEKLLASCKKHGKFAGIHNGTAAYAARMIGMGFRFVTIANDSGLMAKAAKEAVVADPQDSGRRGELDLRYTSPACGRGRSAERSG